jgi:hypothetical protein
VKNGRTGREHPRFRDLLSAGTRPLKHAELGLVANELKRAGLRKKPREYRRNLPPQLKEN